MLFTITECDESSILQKWVYRPALNGRARNSPETNLNLCFEQHDLDIWRLHWCDARNTDQLLEGWKSRGTVELFPAGQIKRCFSQDHDPKFGEEVCPEVVCAAREEKTSLWEAYNPRGSYSDGPPTTFAPRPPQCVKSLGL
mmetsp:Transcript_6688/g.12245  ORF Transcript_6688/g.12245 Transcript_6688/m.12245 type:complete len:141 (+) Transcript_6688:1118-1540(+)